MIQPRLVGTNPKIQGMRDAGLPTRIRQMLLLAVLFILLMDSRYFFVVIDSSFPVRPIDDSPTRLRKSVAAPHLGRGESKSNSKNSNNYKRNRTRGRPLLMLLVGPENMGIQETLARNQSEALLKSDHYKYIGSDKDVVKESLVNTNGNYDLIGSSDYFGDTGNSYRKVLVDTTKAMAASNNATNNKNDWHIRIVISYHRLFELLLEKYYQHYHHHDWPGANGNIQIPTFPEYLWKEADLETHDAARSYEAWLWDFPVSLFHIDREGDPSTNFVCQAIPHADDLCRQLTKDNDSSKKSPSPQATTSTRTNSLTNSSGNNHNKRSTRLLDYEILAVRAYELGLVHDVDNRQKLSRAIEKHHRKQLNTMEENDLPLICPNKKELEKLYNASLRFETWALETMGSGSNAAGIESLKQPRNPVTDFEAHWDAALESKKLCTVDATKALDQLRWKRFFRSRLSQKAMQAFYIE